jgi:hypothetical protein
MRPATAGRGECKAFGRLRGVKEAGRMCGGGGGGGRGASVCREH